jgi:hypothetical protein
MIIVIVVVVIVGVILLLIFCILFCVCVDYSIKLATGQKFDYETKSTQFVITCTAGDGYFQSSSSVTIVVLDTNDPPYFEGGSVQISVNEGGVRRILII